MNNITYYFIYEGVPICPESSEIKLSGGFKGKLFFEDLLKQQHPRNKLFPIIIKLTKIFDNSVDKTFLKISDKVAEEFFRR